MNMVKIQDVKTKVVKEVSKSLASDYIGTGQFVLYKEKKVVENKTSEPKPKNNDDWFKKIKKVDNEN